MKIVIFILCFFTTFFLSAQMVVESPETDALLISQMYLINQLAAGNRSVEFEHFAEYLSQFSEVIATLKNNAAEAAKVLEIGKELKNMSEKEWLGTVEKELADVWPEVSDFVSYSENEVSAVLSAGGKYADYISGWGKKLNGYHDKLLESYGENMMFPELFPAAAEAGNGVRKIIHRAWLESGMESEMKNDAVRERTFRRHYEEYIKSAKENNNIEALGLANLMQSQYVSAETLEHIRKNLDISVMKEQFEQDAADSYLQGVRNRMRGKEKSKNEKTSIFGL